jgi:hypothetical protein
MKIEAAKKILESLDSFVLEKLERAHWRYMHLIDIIEDPNPEDVDQAKEDRKAYAQLLTLLEFDVENSIEFMMNITGLPSDYCEAFIENDFFETYGESSEDVEKKGHI